MKDYVLEFITLASDQTHHMKNIGIIILTLFAALKSNAQNNLVITEVPEKDWYEAVDFHLYKNDSLIYENCESKGNQEILSNLDKGSYLLRYNTIFGIEELNINFDSTLETKTVQLFPEKIRETKLEVTESALENLLDGELIVIEYFLSSCYNPNHKKITITRKNNKYYKVSKIGLRKINSIKIKKIIEYEKLWRNIDRDNNLHNGIQISTCKESVRFSIGKTAIFCRTISCQEWKLSIAIKDFLK